MKRKMKKYVFRAEFNGGQFLPFITETDSATAAWAFVIRNIANKQKLRDCKGIQLVSTDEVTPPWDE